MEEKKLDTKVTLDVNELKSMIDEGVKKGQENFEKFAKKFAFSEKAEDGVKLEKAKKQNDVVKFFSALSMGDKASLTELSNERAKYLQEGNGATGGYLVPEEFERTINLKMDDYSQIRRDATVLPMNTDVKRLNELATDPSVYIVGEAVAITESTPTFAEPVLTARKYAGITAWSNEIGADAELAVVNLIADRFAEKLAQKEQDEFVNGTTSGSEGILQVSGSGSVQMPTGDSTFAKASFDYLNSMIKELQEYSINESRNGKFYMSPYVWSVISQTKPTGSGYYGGNPVNGWDMKAWGIPVVLLNEYPSSTAVSTKFVTLADLKRHLFIGDRAGIRVDVKDVGTVGSNNLFTQDMQAIRVVKRTANTISLAGGIINLITAAS